MTTHPETSPDFFVAGGALRASAQSYVRRPADDDLFNHILLGEFCYVLTPRQMGKTSLMVRTARRLESQGMLTAVVDLTSIGISVTVEQWYLSILTQIGRGLHLTRNVSAWWQEHQELSYMQRFTDFFRHWVMESCAERVVIFIDEIDSTLSLDFRDDFFAGIRSLYNTRFVEPALERLTFVLLGVASPADLIKDGMRTPFNIGHEIVLNEFNREDAAVLSNMLETIFPGQGDRIFQRIFYWTNGHPYLTQKLCVAVVEEPNCLWNDEQIDDKVFSLFLAEESRKESNLKFIQERLLNHPLKNELLRVYYQVAVGKRVRDEGQSILHNELKLSGVVEAKSGFLRTRNRIYQKVFDKTWVRNKLPIPWAAIITSVSIFITVLIFAVLMYNTAILPNQKQDAISNFYREPSPEKRVKHLARLFSLQGIILPMGYKTEAIDMFYKLSYSEMIALFPVGNPTTSENCEDRVTVVNGLYTTLADFRQDRLNSPLLKQMADSLDSCRDQPVQRKATQIETEIRHWLAAREAKSRADYHTAIDEYSESIQSNSANQSTNYELARVYLAIGEYKKALNNLEAMLSNVPAPVAATITPFPSVTKTGALPSISSQVPSTQSVTKLLPTISPPLQTPNLSTMESKSPTPSPTFGAPSLSGFISDADLIDAVRRLVRDDQGCQKYIKQNPLSGYPNLRKFGILPDFTSQQTAIAQVATLNVRMVLIPAGAFQMGGSRYDNENPIHTVTLNAFLMDVYEVTNANYANCVAAGKCQPPADKSSSTRSDYYDNEQYVNYPVLFVSWNGAKTYCEWRGARLPTEAEWEKAARGGLEGKQYPWGDIAPVCTHDAENGAQFYGCATKDTIAVGSFAPNGYGLFDMAGNTWEWVNDWYDENYYRLSPSFNPLGPIDGDKKALRGGGWHYAFSSLRVAYRGWYDAADRSATSFRCAASPP